MPLTLTNDDSASALFLVRVNAISSTGVNDFFSYQFSPSFESLLLFGFEEFEFSLQIAVADDVAFAEGSVITFVVTVEKTVDGTYDFISFSMTATNMPAPQFTDNVSVLVLLASFVTEAPSILIFSVFETVLVLLCR